MRAGIFSPSFPGINGSGGIPVYTRSLATALVELGHEAHVLIHDETGALDRRFTVDGVHVHTVVPRYARVISRWLRGSRESVQTSLAALRLCRRHDLDWFEFPNFDAMGVPFAALARRAPASLSPPPAVVRLHTSTAECLAIEGRPLTVADRFDVWREQAQCARAASLVVSTRAHARHMAGELAVPEERIGILPLGIPDGARPELQAPRPRKTPPTIVYVGRLEPRKGTIDLFHAVPRVLAAVPDARFVVVGVDRPLAPGGLTHAAWLEQNLSPEARARVELTGFVDDAARERLVEEADVFVAPSLYESFGLIFVEAMRVSVPVVGTTAGGIPEVVTHDETGLLVPPKDPERLAAALVRLLTDEPRRLAIAAAGRRRFVEKFSARAMAERTVAHHQETIVATRAGTRTRTRTGTRSGTPHRDPRREA
jgi:glycosyltransferase involved in cell wall biosynthesis